MMACTLQDIGEAVYCRDSRWPSGLKGEACTLSPTSTSLRAAEVAAAEVVQGAMAVPAGQILMLALQAMGVPGLVEMTVREFLEMVNLLATAVAVMVAGS